MGVSQAAFRWEAEKTLEGLGLARDINTTRACACGIIAGDGYEWVHSHCAILAWGRRGMESGPEWGIGVGSATRLRLADSSSPREFEFSI